MLGAWTAQTGTAVCKGASRHCGKDGSTAAPVWMTLSYQDIPRIGQPLGLPTGIMTVCM